MKAILLEILDRMEQIELTRAADPMWKGTTYAGEFRSIAERLLVWDEKRMDQMAGSVGEVASEVTSEPAITVRVEYPHR